jgi:hypothetical protein
MNALRAIACDVSTTRSGQVDAQRIESSVRCIAKRTKRMGKETVKVTTSIATSTAAAAAVIGLVGAGVASAAPTMTEFGESQRLVDGAVISSYTVNDLQPSDDPVNLPVAGQLWEATTTVDAVQGAVTPAIPFFNARTDSGENYRVLFQAFAPEGLDGATLPQGGESSGKIYFDVTGAEPTSVVYNDAVQDRLAWG